MTAFIGYMVSPIAFCAWLKFELQTGGFPAERDSIGIPMFGFLVIWLIGLGLGYVATVAIGIGRITNLGNKTLPSASKKNV